MKPVPAFVVRSCLLLCLTVSCARRAGVEEGRETVLDGIVHLEDVLHTEVPLIPRWCDQLDLVKRRVNVGDCELYVEEESRGTPLVLINGGPGGTHHYFHPWFSRAGRFARVIYYDQRGCGLSDREPGEEGYSVDQAVGDLDAVRGALGIDKWVVLGYSYGGFLAQYYTINHPESVAGLVLLGSSPGMWVEMQRGRQYDYMSDEEREKLREVRTQLQEMREERGWSYSEYINVLLFNNFLNGDWKRQHFLKPSRERVVQIALYEWDQDEIFNSVMSGSMNTVDLTGAFEDCPIPTLILEGKWDLTWNTDKPRILLDNHPGAELVMFENAGHGIYDEEPDAFFRVLRRFVRGLRRVPETAVAEYRDYLVRWDRERKASPRYVLRASDWGRRGNENIAAAYSRQWLDIFERSGDLLKIGFALYDLEDYGEAFFVFEKMQSAATEAGDREYEAMAMIWQGHMLDLLGRRNEAVRLYRRVADMDINERWSHSQFGMSYVVSPYAAERAVTPFRRIENKQK